MGLVPFHMWLPDTYSGSPTTVATLLAAATKKAGFAAAIRIIIIGLIALNAHWSFVPSYYCNIYYDCWKFGCFDTKKYS